MSFRSLLLLIVTALVLLFVVLNWTAITTPTQLNLLFMDVHAPVGIVMLALMVLLSAVFALLLIYMQTSVLMESRRHAKEMSEQRELADKAEASRFTDLRNWIEQQTGLQNTTQESKTRDLLARLDRMEMGLAEQLRALPAASASAAAPRPPVV